jgi:hypothetical protein
MFKPFIEQNNSNWPNVSLRRQNAEGRRDKEKGIKIKTVKKTDGN